MEIERQEKRIYSINLCAYIMCKTDLLPSLHKDEINPNVYWFAMPECSAVRNSIREFKTQTPQVDLHEFLSAIKRIRTSIAAAKGDCNGL